MLVPVTDWLLLGVFGSSEKCVCVCVCFHSSPWCFQCFWKLLQRICFLSQVAMTTEAYITDLHPPHLQGGSVTRALVTS